MINLRKFLPIAAIVAIGLSLGACSHGPRGYAGGPMDSRTAVVSDDLEVEEEVDRAYAMDYRVGRRWGGCKYGRPTITPGGRKACVEHITDRKFLRQPEFNKADQRAKLCAGKTGQLVKINLGEGLVGNYRC